MSGSIDGWGCQAFLMRNQRGLGMKKLIGKKHSVKLIRKAPAKNPPPKLASSAMGYWCLWCWSRSALFPWEGRNQMWHGQRSI